MRTSKSSAAPASSAAGSSPGEKRAPSKGGRRIYSRRSLVLGAIALVVVVGLAYQTRYRWTPQKKKEIQLTTLSGESTILPRAKNPATNRSHEVEVSTRTVHVGGVERAYVLVAPKEPVSEKSYPLILVFHGDGWNAQRFHDAWSLERVTGSDAVLAYADGIGGALGNAWDLETTKDNREVLFSEALIADLEKSARPKIDRQKLFATGYSSGGFMVNVLACHRPGLLRAIASNAGGAPYNQIEKHPNGFPKCPGQEPTPILAMHGEKDHSVTHDSGRFSAEYWAYVNGCSEIEQETTGYPECRAYRNCSSKKQAVFCSIPPLGHWIWDEAPAATWTFFLISMGAPGRSLHF